MGLREWLLRHMPGSPGSIARAMAKAYTRLKAEDPAASRELLLRRTLESRYALSGGLDAETEEEMLRQAGGSLTDLTVRVWSHENPTGFLLQINAPRSILEKGPYGIIDEEICKIAPEVAGLRDDDDEAGRRFDGGV